MSCFFEGWYYKHQNQRETIAFIPGFADDRAFIQVITDNKSFYFEYVLSACRRGAETEIGGSIFSSHGMSLDIHQGGNSLHGKIAYTNLTPLESDIMGFFRLFPMQCRHGIVSLHHRLSGSIRINGNETDFSGGTGYIEKDSGRSFPKNYAWVQSNDFSEKCCIMAAIADIPFIGLRFNGIICAIWYKGREYRLATYYGAKVVSRTNKGMIIQQGKYMLEVHIEAAQGHSLAAPQMGKMSRFIKENPSCRASFRFCEGDTVIFDLESVKTSFEFSE